MKCSAIVVIFGLVLCLSSNLPVNAEDEVPKVEPDRLLLEETDLAAKPPVSKDVVSDKKFTRRLPDYYRDVVSDQQKESIYKIQESYHPIINYLTLRLQMLKDERDAKIQAILSKDQQIKVEQLTEEAKNRRAVAKAEKTDDEK